jgi:CRISPR-associated protein Csx10
MINGTLTIEMKSDWHIGSGAGRPGSVDRLVQRDTHNLPYIPAKSLTGIWRDGCELVAQGLDGGEAGDWQKWVIWLFGEQQLPNDKTRNLEFAPRLAMLAVRSAHMPKALQEAFQGNVLLQNMATFVKPGVKINPHTGSALVDHLRFEEMTRSGTILNADFSIELEGLSKEQELIAKAILVAGASMVDRLGAKRRRGAGRCTITVEKLGDLKRSIAALSETKGTPPEIPSMQDDSGQTEKLDIEAQTDTGWWRIELEVETQSPIIIHKRTVGNHQETQDHIPGTYFLPPIIKHLSGYLKKPLGNALIHGDIVISNANLIVNGKRGQAVPLAIFEPKAKSSEPKIRQRIGEEVSAPSDGIQLKRIGHGYVCLEEEILHRDNVNSEIAAHNTIVDAKQRPDAEIGGIYTYESIPAGLTFRFEVRLRDSLITKDAVNPLEKFLKEEVLAQIGRTKKDDYGNVKIKQIDSGKIRSEKITETDGTLIVWLLSNVLLRDARLRPTNDPQILGRKLGMELGVTLTLLGEPRKDGLPSIDRLVAFARSSRTESWQTKWGLPRPSLVGLSAGSVFQFQVEGEINQNKMQALMVSGLGERTAEGYGQLCFNHKLLTSREIANPKDKDSHSLPARIPGAEIKKESEEYDYAKLIEQETWREMICRAAGAIAAEPGKLERLKALSTNESKLTRSKLGTLRSLIDGLKDARDSDRVVKVLDNMQGKEKWKGGTLACVRKIVEAPEEVWTCYEEMGCSFSEYRLTDRAEADLKKELWAESVRILVDACIRSHRRASEPSSSSQEQANG